MTITAASGSLSHSAVVTLQIYVPGVAGFLRTDTTTQGTWKGVYGADGEAISNDSAHYPAYAQVSLSGVTAYSWAASTTDVRALQKAAATDRIASTWFATANFTIDVNLMDGNAHQVGLYCLDWDGGRSETIDILDATTGSILDTRSLTSFSQGVWMLWNLSGHVTIRVTRTVGANAVASGIFFNLPATPDFNVSVTPGSQAVAQGASTTYTVAVAPSAGFTGTASFSASGLPSGATASFNPVSVSVPGSSTMSVTVGSGTPLGTYPVTITGTSGASSHTATATLQVYVPGAAAVFAATDTVTQGAWKGVYGSNGEAIANDSANYPGGLHWSHDLHVGAVNGRRARVANGGGQQPDRIHLVRRGELLDRCEPDRRQSAQSRTLLSGLGWRPVRDHRHSGCRKRVGAGHSQCFVVRQRRVDAVESEWPSDHPHHTHRGIQRGGERHLLQRPGNARLFAVGDAGQTSGPPGREHKLHGGCCSDSRPDRDGEPQR